MEKKATDYADFTNFCKTEIEQLIKKAKVLLSNLKGLSKNLRQFVKSVAKRNKS